MQTLLQYLFYENGNVIAVVVRYLNAMHYQHQTLFRDSHFIVQRYEVNRFFKEAFAIPST